MGSFKEFYLESKDVLSKEYTYNVIYKGHKIEVSGKNLMDVKPKAFQKLNVPDSDKEKVSFVLIKRDGKQVNPKSIH